MKNFDDAIKVIKALNSKNINATLDHLGEHTSNPEKAVQATKDVIAILERIHSGRSQVGGIDQIAPKLV